MLDRIKDYIISCTLFIPFIILAILFLIFRKLSDILEKSMNNIKGVKNDSKKNIDPILFLLIITLVIYCIIDYCRVH